MNNLDIYDSLRSVPEEAQKKIKGGRLNGFTDINPMWRIKKLTETFGMVGFGWKYQIQRQWLETGAGGVVSAFSHINLYVKVDGEWSEPIEGIGGSSFVSIETKGAYTSDECFKMALSDAIGIACKALGMAADVYFEKDTTKYDIQPEPKPTQPLLDKRTAVLNFFNEHTDKLQEMCRVWNLGSPEDLSDNQVELVYKKYCKP